MSVQLSVYLVIYLSIHILRMSRFCPSQYKEIEFWFLAGSSQEMVAVQLQTGEYADSQAYITNGAAVMPNMTQVILKLMNHFMVSISMFWPRDKYIRLAIQ